MKIVPVIGFILVASCKVWAQGTVTPATLDFHDVRFTIQTNREDGLIMYSMTIKRKTGSPSTFYLVRLSVQYDENPATICSLAAEAQKDDVTFYRFRLSESHIKGSTVTVEPFDPEAKGSLLNHKYTVKLEAFLKKKFPNQVPEDTARKLADPQH